MTIDSLCVSLRINPDEPPLRNVSIRLTHRNSDTPAWDLSTVADRYAAFQDRYSRVLEWLSKHPSMRSAEAFALRLCMMHDLRRVRIMDPQLPSNLLPKGWKGIKALEMARQIYQALLPLSEHYITEFMNGPNASMPAAEKSFYERFGGLSPA